MPSEAVQPLRINKFTPSPSPTKMSGTARPLSELGPTERRRNSPSYIQATKKMIVSGDSPFESSPLSPSTYAMWRKRDNASPSAFSSENERENSPSPRRSSIENLKKASRVKNSNMFAREHKHEYDPSSLPLVERPLAAGRPLNGYSPGNAGVGEMHASPGKQKPAGKGHKRAESSNKIPIYDGSDWPEKVDDPLEPVTAPLLPLPPWKSQDSPTKSSLSANGRYNGAPRTINRDHDAIFDHRVYDPSPTELTPRSLVRHAKSVTFDVAPPQVNEYEAPTPDPSSITSGSREGSYESVEGYEGDGVPNNDLFAHDDSFDESLEDTDKTPVVLPEDWRQMSPEAANTELADTFEDPFGSTEGKTISGAKAVTRREVGLLRTNSTTSNGENRPLPPLPPALGVPLTLPESNFERRSDAAVHASTLERWLPTIPGSATPKAPDASNVGESSRSLLDRLKAFATQQSQDKPVTSQREKEVQSSDTIIGNPETDFAVHEDVEENDDVADLADYKPPPRISRESILRNVKSHHFDEQDFMYDQPNLDSTSSTVHEYADIDPDYPIPSREASSNYESQEQPQESPLPIKIEDEEPDEVDLYSIPEIYIPKEGSSSRRESYGREGSVVHHPLPEAEESEYGDDVVASRYSPQPGAAEIQKAQFNGTTENDSALTPPSRHPEASLPILDDIRKDSPVNLPDFASFLTEDDDFKEGFRSFMSSTPPQTRQQPLFQPQVSYSSDTRSPSGSLTPQEELTRPRFPPSRSDSGAGTPESVIHHSSPSLSPEPESPSIPEPVATVKAPGGKLKTRPSATRADLKAMISARRQASGQGPPSVFETSDTKPSDMNESEERQSDDKEGRADIPGEFPSMLTESLMLDVPTDGLGDGLGLGLDEEFERIKQDQKVPSNPTLSNAQSHITTNNIAQGTSLSTESAEHIPGQGFTPQRKTTNKYIRSQKGYLMRQNTKVVVATSRKFSEENQPMSVHSEVPTNVTRETKAAESSPTKSNHERIKSWTTEPWNGKIRRKSVRLSMSSPQKSLDMATAPPLPGHESAVTGLSSLDENEDFGIPEETSEGAERGRLFVKVVGVKDLALSLPRHERTYFQLTLDNGLHCVTTAWLELGKSAPIGQEFELVVFNELEFQLTLQTKLKRPAPEPVIEPVSPVKSVRIQKSASSFARVFISPKKRKELERKHQEEEERLAREENQRQQEMQARARARREPSAWDLLHDLVASDGSFARAYISLKNHEQDAFGRPFTVDVPLFNEWTVEDTAIAHSVKSRRGGIPRRPPYRIGKLELQLFYVPKPRGATEDDMPKSMSACVKEMKEAENAASKLWEGYLSQQGGDCPYWRRRFFKLSGSKLTAFHETTLQPRATINLAKATKLIDDRSSLTQKETSSRNGGRRKSAFAEEEEGYMFVEEGFRIRFANGETIDFYADDAPSKDGWMKVLSETIGKEGREGGKWTDLVLAKERMEKAKTNKSGRNDMPPPPQPPTATHAHPPTPSTPSFNTAPTPTQTRIEPESRWARAGSQSAPTSPMKSAPMVPSSPRQRRADSPTKAVTGWRAPTPTSAKLMAAAAQAAQLPPQPVDKSPRHLLHAAMTGVARARKGAAASVDETGSTRKKRDAIRSMIF